MSDRLRSIAARYAAGLRAARSLAPVSDARRLALLCAVARYGMQVNYFMTMLDLAERGHGDVTEADWPRFMRPKETPSAHFMQWARSEEKVVGYVCTCMAWLFPDLPREESGVWAGKRLDRSALDEVLARFPSLPDAVEYLP